MGYLDYAGLQYLWSKLKEKFAPKSHSHDDRYYTESEMDGKLSGKVDNTEAGANGLINKLESGTAAPVDDDLIITQWANHTTATAANKNKYVRRPMSSIWSYIKGKADGVYQPKGSYAASGHTHDDRYYTEAEVNTKLNGKSNIGHTHDDRYYTESEINTKLNGKANSSHTHTKAQITDFPASLKNPTALTIQTNGTTAATYDGSAAKTVNITKGNIGLGNVDNTADKNKSVASAAKLTTARTVSGGSDITLSFNYDGSGNSTANIGFYSCWHSISNTNNYPFHRFAKLNANKGAWVDSSMTFLISQDYSGGGYGVCRLVYRSNADSGSATVVAQWLVRRGLSADTVQVAIKTDKTNGTYCDAFYKSSGTYMGVVIRAIASGGRATSGRTWALIDSNEASGTTATDKKTSSECWKTIAEAGTALHKQAYSASASATDEGYVASAGSANSANTATIAVKLARSGNTSYPMTFNWSGKSGQPTWLWGGENGTDMYVYNPSNFNVNYAKSAGSVTWGNVSGKPSTFTPASHTHNYAGSGSAGGSANSAVKLDSSAGSNTQPVYFSGGKPVVIGYTIAKSVPADAKFTDTNTWRGVQNNLTSTATDQSLSAAQGKILNETKAPASGSNNYVRVYNSNNVGCSGSVTLNDLAKQHCAVAMINSATDNPLGKTGWVHALSMAWTNNNNSNWVSQIALGVQDSNGMWYRTNQGATVGASWKRVYDSNYHPNADYASSAGSVAWGNVSGKPSSYPPSSHSHAYLPLGGGTMTGQIKRDVGCSWINDRDSAIVYGTSSGTGSGYHPVVGQKTPSGAWTIGTYINENLIFDYTTDTDKKAGKNNAAQVYLPAQAGTIITSATIGSQNVASANGVTPEWSGSVDLNSSSWLAAWSSDGKKIKAMSTGTFAKASHTHTKDQVGLGNVDNTADKDKSVKYATTAELALNGVSAYGNGYIRFCDGIQICWGAENCMNKSTQVIFAVPFFNSNYVVTITNHYDNFGSTYWTTLIYTKTTFYIKGSKSSVDTRNVNWIAIGQWK